MRRITASTALVLSLTYSGTFLPSLVCFLVLLASPNFNGNVDILFASLKEFVICGALLRQPLSFCQSRTEVRSFLLSFVSLFCLHLPILMEMWIFFSLPLKEFVICGALLRQPLSFCQSRTEVRSFLLSFVSLFCLHLPILMEMWIFFSLCFAQRNCDMR